MKAVRNEAGSTLMVIVIFLSILTMMAMALMTATAAHYRTQKKQEERKAAFYQAESGLDMVVANLTMLVDSVSQEAGNAARLDLRDDIYHQAFDYEKYLEYKRNSQNENVPPGGSSSVPPLINTDDYEGTLNQNNIYATFDQLYRGYFIEKFREAIEGAYFIAPGGTAVNELESAYDTAHGLTGELSSKSGFFNFTQSPYSLTMGFFSIFREEGMARKLLTLDITVNVPTYRTPVEIEQNVVKFDPNILWTKALTTEGGLNILDGSVNIYGNVYAGGSVTIGSPNTTVNGEIATNRSIRFSSNNSSLTVQGNAYAENIITDSALRNCTLLINAVTGRTAYTYDSMTGSGSPLGNATVKHNLELRGTNPTISIDGTFTAFTELDLGTAATTSSVIVDTTNDGADTFTGSLRFGGDVIICGTAVYHLEGGAGVYFNTGESIAIRGNYMAYSNMLIEPFFSNFAAKYKARHNITADYNEYDLIYQNPGGLFMPDMWSDGNVLNAYDRADYLYEIASMESAPDFEETWMSRTVTYPGSVLTLNPSRYMSMGVGFANSSDILRNAQPLSHDELRLGQASTNARLMFDIQTKAFGDLNHYSTDEIDQQALFGDLISFRTAHEKMLLPALSTELILINSDASQTITIGSNTTDSPYSVNYEQGSTLKAIIITAGSVSISGDLELRGTIISGGGITISGGSNVTIINDRDFIAKAMYYGGSLLGFSSSPTVIPSYSYSASASPIDKNSFVFVTDRDVALAGGHISIEGIVSTSNWSVIEY